MVMKRLASSLVLCLATASVSAADGLTTLKSPRDAKATMDKFEDLVKQRGLTVFARIDHAAAAARVDKKLRPTELLIFGSPQAGTPFMECAQSVGIDLPLKVLVWEDQSSQVWLGFNDPAFIAQRHGVAQCPAAENIRKAITGLAEAAVAP